MGGGVGSTWNPLVFVPVVEFLVEFLVIAVLPNSFPENPSSSTRFLRKYQISPPTRRISATPPPTAIPMMAPNDSGEEEEEVVVKQFPLDRVALGLHWQVSINALEGDELGLSQSVRESERKRELATHLLRLGLSPAGSDLASGSTSTHI